MKKFIVAGLALVLLGTAASAHHSLAPYNRSTTKTVEGTVKEFSWSNPHVKIAIAVAGADGDVKEWNFEGSSVYRLTERGFKRNAVMPGDKVIVAYNPKRDGSIGGFFVAVTGADGHVYGADALKAYNKGD